MGILLGLCFAAIGAKAVYLQVYRASWLAKKAAGEYERSIKTYLKRGTIYDSTPREMAVSIDATSIAAFPGRIKNPKRTATVLAKALGSRQQSIYKKLVARKPFVWVKRQITPGEEKSLKALKLDGIGFLPESNRFYPNKTLGAQILGFTGIDGNGLEGIEFYYDAYLKGATVEQTILKDALGRGFNAEKETTTSFGGYSLHLTIASPVQFAAERVLEETVKTYSAKGGMIVVMSPKTGAILAVAHYPFFNPNTYRKYKKNTWRNRAVTDPFEPGSTMKIFSAAAALESGNASPHTIFYCENGKYRIGKDVVHDVHPHGWLSLQQIVKYSSNIGAVKIGERVGRKKLYKTLQAFGFGTKTGIDCPGETGGSLLPYKRWSRIDAGAISFGQGISVSAIQLVAATSAIANDGILMKPYIVHSIRDGSSNLMKQIAPSVVRRVISVKTARTLNRIMQTVTTPGGTGVNAALGGYKVSGKTGTAQKVGKNGTYAKGKYVASFIGFVPANDPAATILVAIDEPKGKIYGGTIAAPAFKQIAHETLNYLNTPPERGAESLRVSREDAATG
jgi:cell division protein FtsI (penicillin-binding protein 3)